LNTFFFSTGPTRPKKNGPKSTQKMKSGHDRPKKEPTCGWTQPSRVGWADVPAQKTNSGLLCSAQCPVIYN